MKSILLQTILEQIDGVVIQGSGNPLIENVVYKPRKITNHTLLFYRYKEMEMDLQLFETYNNLAVVTDAPNDYEKLSENVILIQVADIEDAYWKFVNYYRNLFQIPIIGITGTCGKTTTKQMVKHILRKYFNVQSTFLSNNQRSLNLKYLLGIDDEIQAAVFEMPVASPGYLTNTIKYFQPQIRILLNIDVYHLKDCKTPEAYMKAKAEIINGLDPENGIIIINSDDGNIRNNLDLSGFKRVVTFGFMEGCHFQAKNIHYADGGMQFTMHHQNQNYPVFVPGYGKHNVYNALAAIAASSSAEMGIQESCERLASFEQIQEHMEFHSGTGGCTVIDDTWNVAPLSMAAALEVLHEIAGSKQKIAILGYMPQLGEGEYAIQQYAKLGEKVVETQVDLLCIVGEEAKGIGLKALELGMDPSKIYDAASGTEIYDLLKPLLNQDSIILFKIPHRVMIKSSFKRLKRKVMGG
jgi:UDP-N-acetylmuramoyl-tripeptide--D-alanyl-D-alanine ligase